MERLAATYDVGLVAENGYTRSRQVCLTNKLFSYLLAGIPPLLSATPAHRLFAANSSMTDLLYPIDDAEALAALCDRLFCNPKSLANARNAAWRLGQGRYNWEGERPALIGVVCDAMHSLRNARHRT